MASAPAMAVEINKEFIQNWKVLVKGSPIHGANGLAFDTQDRLHIASVIGREIIVMDPRTGKILDRLGPDVGVESPDDITFGPLGSVYQDDIFWTALFTGEVGRLSPDGTKITAGQVFPGVNPITFSDDNRLFVAHDFFGNAGLFEIDPDGILPPTMLDPNFYNLNAFDFGPDGLLYGPIYQEKILRIDVDSSPLWSEDILDPFISPAMKFDSHGRLFALNIDRVVQIDPETGAVEEVFGNAQTVAPYGDDLLVSGWFSSSVEVRDGETLHLIDGPHLFDLPLNAISFNGDIAVAELGTGSVVDGNHVPIATSFFVPTGLAATGSDLWVADWAMGTVFQIVDDGIPVTIPVASGLIQPEGLAVNTDGSLLVVESGAGRLSRIDLATGEVAVIAEGLELGAQGVPGYPPTWMFSGVTVGSSGHIYVTGDTANLLYRFKQHP